MCPNFKTDQGLETRKYIKMKPGLICSLHILKSSIKQASFVRSLKVTLKLANHASIERMPKHFRTTLKLQAPFKIFATLILAFPQMIFTV